MKWIIPTTRIRTPFWTVPPSISRFRAVTCRIIRRLNAWVPSPNVWRPMCVHWTLPVRPPQPWQVLSCPTKRTILLRSTSRAIIIPKTAIRWITKSIRSASFTAVKTATAWNLGKWFATAASFSASSFGRALITWVNPVPGLPEDSIPVLSILAVSSNPEVISVKHCGAASRWHTSEPIPPPAADVRIFFLPMHGPFGTTRPANWSAWFATPTLHRQNCC